MSEPAIRFVPYSEDTAGDSLETLRHLLLGMLRRVCPAVKTNHVQVEPVLASDERISGSFWKARTGSRDSQRLRGSLIRAVATALARKKVVFFHVDADATWAEHVRRGCENLREHWPRFCADVLAVWGASKAQAELEQVLILAMPFYELESWAFANTRRLRELLTDEGDLAAFVGWESDLAALDEIADIKDVLSIGGMRNLELVQARFGFQVAALDEVGKSFSATIARLRASEVIRHGLEQAAARDF